MTILTFSMAVVDFLGAAFFSAGSLILMSMLKQDIYIQGIHNYTFFSAGAFMVMASFLLKLCWDFFYVTGLSNYPLLLDCFFPFQAFGFLLMSIGFLGYIVNDNKRSRIAKIIYGTVSGLIMLCLVILFALLTRNNLFHVPHYVLVADDKIPFVVSVFFSGLVLSVSFSIKAFQRKRYLVFLFFIMAFLLQTARYLTEAYALPSVIVQWTVHSSDAICQALFMAGTLFIRLPQSNEGGTIRDYF